MPTQEKKITRQEHEAREVMLKDRLAICLIILRHRHGDDWNPWFGEGMWEDPDGMAEVLRHGNEYETALDVVDLFISRSER